MSKIQTTRMYAGEYILQHTNGYDLGTLSLNSSGEYHWYLPPNISGCLPAHILKEIAQELDKLNETNG